MLWAIDCFLRKWQKRAFPFHLPFTWRGKNWFNKRKLERVVHPHQNGEPRKTNRNTLSYPYFRLFYGGNLSFCAVLPRFKNKMKLKLLRKRVDIWTKFKIFDAFFLETLSLTFPWLLTHLHFGHFETQRYMFQQLWRFIFDLFNWLPGRFTAVQRQQLHLSADCNRVVCLLKNPDSAENAKKDLQDCVAFCREYLCICTVNAVDMSNHCPYIICT